MKKKYTKKQILESIKYWKKQLNETTNLSYDNAKDAIKAIVENLAYISKAIDNASESDAEVINRVLAWNDTEQMLDLAVHSLSKLLGYKDVM